MDFSDSRVECSAETGIASKCEYCEVGYEGAACGSCKEGYESRPWSDKSKCFEIATPASAAPAASTSGSTGSSDNSGTIIGVVVTVVIVAAVAVIAHNKSQGQKAQ